MKEMQNPHLQNPPDVHNFTSILNIISCIVPCAKDCGMCTSEYTLHHNINVGHKTAEELTANKLLLVIINTHKNFWNTVK